MPICLECCASGTGSCQCGAGYVPAGERAKAAIAANPGKSDRATAAEIGVHKNTVARARDTSGPHGPVDQPRTGLDGQTRRPLSRRIRWAGSRKVPEKFLPKTYQIYFCSPVAPWVPRAKCLDVLGIWW